MAKIYYQEDCNLALLEGKTIAVIGYGSQGHAHALNMKESGVHVIIGLYEGSKSWAKAEAQGVTVMTAADAANSSVFPSITAILDQIFPKNDYCIFIQYCETKVFLALFTNTKGGFYAQQNQGGSLGLAITGGFAVCVRSYLREA